MAAPFCLASLSLVLALAPAPASGAGCPTRSPWPTADWPDATAEVTAARPSEIQALEDYAFTLTGADAQRKGIRTDSVVIVQGGQVVYERYARGFNASRRHVAWSVTKSVTGALTGVAVQRGALELEDSICSFLADVPGDNCGIQVGHLLEFGSGIDWKEIYENQSNQQSSVLAMLYGQGHTDMASFVGAHRRRDEPGASYQYSTGESTLLAAVVGAALEPALGPDWPWSALFDPLGMTSAVFERDAAGRYVGGAFLLLTARDLARFGFLLLNDGCWEDQRLLPEGWVAHSTKVNDAIKKKSVERADGDVQGWQLWLNRPVPEIGQGVPMPDVPQDAFMALGHWGQSCTMVPSLDLVVVRMGDDRETAALDQNEFLKRAIAVGRRP